MRDNDYEGLDLVTLGSFEHFIGDCQTPAIIEIREEMMDLARTRLANGEVSPRTCTHLKASSSSTYGSCAEPAKLLAALPYAVALFRVRNQDLLPLEAASIRCPVVLLRVRLYDAEKSSTPS